MRKIESNFFSNDLILTGGYIMLLFFGFISIYSSQNTDGYNFLSYQNESFKQLIWISICLTIFFAVSILEYRFIFDLAVPLYFISLFISLRISVTLFTVALFSLRACLAPFSCICKSFLSCSI